MSGEKEFLEAWRSDFPGGMIRPEKKPFELQGDPPNTLIVRCTSEPESATKLYSLIGDYGWAEMIFFSSAYLHHAQEIGERLSNQTGIGLRVEV